MGCKYQPKLNHGGERVGAKVKGQSGAQGVVVRRVGTGQCALQSAGQRRYRCLVRRRRVARAGGGRAHAGTRAHTGTSAQAR